MEYIERDSRAEREPKEVRQNDTGIPDALFRRAQSRTDVSLSDVRVHYNSPMPAKVGALAYTQGSQVYIAAGQERHLPHELGHVVQQKEGRVRPTITVNGFAVNDDERLEREADQFL